MTDKRLLNFQKKLLRWMDPSNNWGSPDYIEDTIVQMVKH
jgi:hypothetical protein